MVKESLIIVVLWVPVAVKGKKLTTERTTPRDKRSNAKTRISLPVFNGNMSLL